jgi:hypothetical protein
VGFTPFYLLYGREPALPMGTQSQIILPVSTDHKDWDLEEATTHLLQRIDDLANAHGKALVNLEKAQEKQKRDFDNRHRTFEEDKRDDQKIEIGDYVIARTAKRSKVHSNAIPGAFRVVGLKTRGLVEVEDRKGDVYPYHLNNVDLILKKDQVDEKQLMKDNLADMAAIGM